MKIMSRRKGGDSVNNESAGVPLFSYQGNRVYYSVYYIHVPLFNNLFMKKLEKRFKLSLRMNMDVAYVTLRKG